MMTSWHNTEFRSYHFQSDDPLDFHLIETDESKAWQKLAAESRNAREREEAADIPPTVQMELNKVEEAVQADHQVQNHPVQV